MGTKPQRLPCVGKDMLLWATMIILHFRTMLLTVVQVGRRESHRDCSSRPGEVVVGSCVTAVGVGERGEDLPGGLRT